MEPRLPPIYCRRLSVRPWISVPGSAVSSSLCAPGGISTMPMGSGAKTFSGTSQRGMRSGRNANDEAGQPPLLISGPGRATHSPQSRAAFQGLQVQTGVGCAWILGDRHKPGFEARKKGCGSFAFQAPETFKSKRCRIRIGIKPSLEAGEGLGIGRAPVVELQAGNWRSRRLTHGHCVQEVHAEGVFSVSGVECQISRGDPTDGPHDYR